MKLIVVMSIAEYSRDVRKILVKQNIPIFSEMEMEGFRVDKEKSIEDNWFADRDRGIYSRVYLAFVDSEQADHVLNAVHKYNDDHKDHEMHPLRAFQLNVEKTI